MPFKFLLFDLDYTLLDFNADMTMAFERLYRHAGLDRYVPYSSEMLDMYERHNSEWWRRFESGKCTKPELFVGRFVDFLNEAGFEADAEKLNDEYFEFLATGGTAYDGALDMLKRLSQTRDIYIITNGNAASAGARIKNSGVYRYIKGYFVSETIGCAKPDIRYFDYSFSHIEGFKKEEALVIGDSLFSDISGANAAGVKSLWYNPNGAPAQGEARFDYEACGFEQMTKIIESAG